MMHYLSQIKSYRFFVPDKKQDVVFSYKPRKYICQNSDFYGEQFCKKKSIRVQDLETVVEAALRMYTKLFLDTKEVLQRFDGTSQAMQIKIDYKRQIADTNGRLEHAQSMNSNFTMTMRMCC